MNIKVYPGSMLGSVLYINKYSAMIQNIEDMLHFKKKKNLNKCYFRCHTRKDLHLVCHEYYFHEEFWE